MQDDADSDGADESVSLPDELPLETAVAEPHDEPAAVVDLD